MFEFATKHEIMSFFTGVSFKMISYEPSLVITILSIESLICFRILIDSAVKCFLKLAGYIFLFGTVIFLVLIPLFCGLIALNNKIGSKIN